jgi:ketol-acid reductoisomerase
MSANQLKILRGDEVPIDGLKGKRISIIGYGNQGRVHAQNLRDSGLNVCVYARNPEKAIQDGFDPTPIEEASGCNLVIFALPDEVQGEFYKLHVEPNLGEGTVLGFIHGFSIHYGHIEPPVGTGIVMVAPKGPGVTVRAKFLDGSGVPALLAVQQENASRTARSIALGWAAGVGSARVGVFESTFADETETDLFGEQAVIVGGLAALVKASYETLVEAGYPPQLAYIECCHEVKQVADILQEKGMSDMMAAISNTAEMGAYEAMDLLDDEHLRTHLRTLLQAVRDGSFAKRLVDRTIENKQEELRNHEIDQVGKEIRSLMQPDTD